MNSEFLIIGGILSAVMAMFVCLICWNNLDKHHPIVRLLVGLLISCALGYGIVGAVVADHNAEQMPSDAELFKHNAYGAVQWELYRTNDKTLEEQWENVYAPKFDKIIHNYWA